MDDCGGCNSRRSMCARLAHGWLADDYTPKTINNRFQTLRHLYRVLDGPRRRRPLMT